MRLGILGLVCCLAAACPAVDWQTTIYDGTRYSRTNSPAEIIFQPRPNYAVLLTYELPRPQPKRFSSSSGVRYKLTSNPNDLRGCTVRCKIFVFADSPVFASRGTGTWNDCPPIAARIWFTDWPGLYSNITSAQHPEHFWWSRAWVAIATGGELAVAIAPEGFSNGIGQVNPATFAQCAANVTDIGISLGTQCFFDTGAALTSGSGSLTLNLEISN